MLIDVLTFTLSTYIRELLVWVYVSIPPRLPRYIITHFFTNQNFNKIFEKQSSRAEA